MAMFTPDQLAYLEAHIGETLVPNVLATVIACAIISFIAVALRFYSRSLTRNGFGADDWMTLAAYLAFVAFYIGFGLATRWGLGQHILAVTDAKSLAQSNISDEVWYGVAMAFVKFAILLFYLRIFPQKAFRIAVYCTMGVVASWMLADIFGSIFQCIPIESQWDPSKGPAKCIDFGQFTLAIGIINIVTDILVLVLPIPIVWGLNMKMQKKLLTISLFAFGSCACIVSIVRLTVAEKVGSTYDASWDDTPGGILSCVEICVGLVAGSIPTYRPLVNKLMGRSTATQEYPNNYNNMFGKRTDRSGIVQTTDIHLSTRSKHDLDSATQSIAVVSSGGKTYGRRGVGSEGERLYERLE